MLYVNVYDISSMDRDTRELFKAQHGAFVHNKIAYLPVTLKGSPENLFLNAKEGIAIPVGEGELIAYFDGDLNSAIAGKNLYDFSKDYAHKVSFAREIEFLIERYITPYRK